MPELRRVTLSREIGVWVWVCPDCGSVERYDAPTSEIRSYTPYCEYCDDDPEGRAEVDMVLHFAVSASAWDAAEPLACPACNATGLTPSLEGCGTRVQCHACHGTGLAS